MSLRLKVALGLAIATFAVCHVAAAVHMGTPTGPTPVAMLDAD